MFYQVAPGTYLGRDDSKGITPNSEKGRVTHGSRKPSQNEAGTSDDDMNH